MNTKIAICAVLLATAGAAHAELYRNLSPGGNFSLANWYLRLPVDADGGTSGIARIVRADELAGAEGYRSRWFYTDGDGGMRMSAPIFGARSATSPNARCELREMLDPDDGAVNWDTRTPSILRAQLRVLRVPSNGKMIVGQVHGYGNGQTLLGLQYEYDAAAGSGDVVAVVIPDPDPDSAVPHQRLTVARGIRLHQTLSYQIEVLPRDVAASTPAQLSVRVNGGAPVLAPVAAAWDAVGLFFAAGAYPQDHEGEASEDGAVVFFQLAASHPGAAALEVASAALLPSASAAHFYQQRLEAHGGVGSPRWKLVSGHPPRGLRLGDDGLLSGTPAASAVSDTPNKFTVRAIDSTGATADRELRLVVQR